MSQSVTVMSAHAIDPGEFRELIRDLGGEADPEMGADARLSRGRDHVWVYGPDDLSEDDPDDEIEDTEADAEFERLLGGPIVSGVTLEISRSPGSPRLALEIIEAAAARGWRLAVDTGHEALALDALRGRAARFSSIFWEAPWEWNDGTGSGRE